jgi:hypothetical protein
VTEEMEVLALVARRLDACRIAYMVTGSVAANYYAVPRMTRDIDIVVELAAADVEVLLALFGEDFYVDRDALRDAVADRGMVNLIHRGHMLKVDLIVRKDGEYRLVEFARRRRTTVGEAEISIVAPEDLIISKLDWSRETRSAVQSADVRRLLRSVPGLDLDYLTHWTERLGLGAAYREAGG